MSETINLDGIEVPCSLAWRLAIRRMYRHYRRQGWGPMAAHEYVTIECRKIRSVR